MKHRIKKHYNEHGVLTYIPQYRRFFMWFCFEDYYGEDISFDNETDAVCLIKSDIRARNIAKRSNRKNKELDKNNNRIIKIHTVCQ